MLKSRTDGMTLEGFPEMRATLYALDSLSADPETPPQVAKVAQYIRDYTLNPAIQPWDESVHLTGKQDAVATLSLLQIAGMEDDGTYESAQARAMFELAEVREHQDDEVMVLSNGQLVVQLAIPLT